MSKIQLLALLVIVLLISIGGGLLGSHLHGGTQPTASTPAPAADLPIDEVARRAKDLVMQEMRDSFRERVSQARSPKKESEKQDVSELPLVEIENYGSFQKELEENEVAFFAKYGNKRVRIAGACVKTVKIGAEWQEYAAEVELTVPTIVGGYEVGKVLRCRVNPDQLDAVARIKEGQEVVVVGVPTKETAFPTLSDCTITVVEK